MGLLILKHEIDEGIFISNKTYFIRVVKGTAIIKAKGIKSSSVSYKDFVDLLNNKNVETAVKRQSKTYWDLGYVVIDDKEKIKINFNSYIRREKLFNTDNHKEWINTKPLVICDNEPKDSVDSAEADLLTNNKKFTVNKSLQLKAILTYILLFFIISVSIIAYILTLEDGECNLDELSIYNKTNSCDNNKQLNSKDYSSTDMQQDFKANNEVQVISDNDEYKFDVSTEQDKSNDCLSEVGNNADPLIKEIYKGPEKTLYKGFEEELFRIQNQTKETKEANIYPFSPTDTESSKTTSTTAVT